MKKIQYILLAVLGLCTVSCSQDVLDIPQKSVDETEMFLENAGELEVQRLTASMYYGVRNFYQRPWFLIANEITGDNWTGGSDSTDQPPHIKIGNLAISADNAQIYDMWNNCYNMIYRCNIVVDAFKDSQEDYKKRAVAEAKGIRAWGYLNLVMMWGNPPLVDHVLQPEEFEMPNTPAQTVWAFIEENLTEAAAVLPSKKNPDGQQAIGGRLTKEACLGLLAKAQLYQGKYSEAAANLKKVMDSKLYELNPEFSNLLRLSGDFCREYLFEIDENAVDMTTAIYGILSDYYWYNGLRPELINHPDELWASSWGFINTTDAFAKEMIEHDGSSPRRVATVLTFDEFATDGLYFHYTVRKPGLNLPWFSSAGYARVKGVTYTSDRLPSGGWVAHSLANRPILRYADILLMYAECAANGAGDKSLGLECLNMVRRRAGLDDASSLSMDDPRYGIKAERRFEFYFECADHWYDLLRWKDFVSERQRLLDKYDIGHSIPSMTTDSSVGDWKFTREVFEDGEKPDAHHMLLPYPYDELTANPSLEQNPGY